jgi:hypothetical protein
MIVFNSGFNEFTGKYLVKKPGEDQRALAATFTVEYKKALASVIEQLLLFDKIAIKVYGENIPLVVLINELGLKQVLELIEEGTIEFVLWTPMLTTLTEDDPNLMGKVNPIQSGNLNSPPHCDPNESVKTGLKWLKVQPDRRGRRDIERKAAKAYKIPKAEFVHNAADIVTSAYSSGKLADVGMPNNKDVRLLERDERFQLLRFGDEILETTILADFNYSSLGNYRYYDLSRQSVDAIKAAGVIDNMKTINAIETLPDIKMLVEAGQIDLKELIRLRRKSVSKKFRQWLASHSSEDSDYISKQYINEIASNKGFLETRPGKFIKTMGVYGISIGIGSAIDGATGGLIGAGAAKGVEYGAELGLALIDNYLLDGILKGWQPKLFINEYEKLLASRS